MDTAFCVVVFWAVVVSVMFFIVLQDGFRLLDENTELKQQKESYQGSCAHYLKLMGEQSERHAGVRVERDGLLEETKKLRESKAAVIADAQGKLSKLFTLADDLMDEFNDQREPGWDEELDDYEDDEDSDLDYCDDEDFEEDE